MYEENNIEKKYNCFINYAYMYIRNTSDYSEKTYTSPYLIKIFTISEPLIITVVRTRKLNSK